MTPNIRGLKSIVLTSSNPDALAAFYRDVLGLPLEQERHKGTDVHWACQDGPLHWAIHPRDGFWLPANEAPENSTLLSFTIESLDAFLAHLQERGVEVVARRNIGPMKSVTIRDPDGRLVSCGTPWPARRAA